MHAKLTQKAETNSYVTDRTFSSWTCDKVQTTQRNQAGRWLRVEYEEVEPANGYASKREKGAKSVVNVLKPLRVVQDETSDVCLAGR